MGTLNHPLSVSIDFGGRKLTLESGRFAKQAHGSVFITYGETTALVTAVSSAKPKEGIDFLPLTVEFQEKFYASGKIPGGFFKREARPSEWATLNARMVDRPLRPLFPEAYYNETQVVVTLLSYDGENEAETIAGLGASAALYISEIPFSTPIATVRVGRIGGKYVINPTVSQQTQSDLSVLVAGSKDAIMMVEGGADNALEEDFLGAVFFGFDEIKKLVQLQEQLREITGNKTKRALPVIQNTVLESSTSLEDKIKSLVSADLSAAFSQREKALRYKALDDVAAKVVEALSPELVAAGKDEKEAKDLIKDHFSEVKKSFARQYTFSSGQRIDGRAYNQVRPIECDVSLLPRVHGSSLFTRGETQALVTVTLGTSEDEQLIDSVRGKYNKKVMLHYNFPPFSVGETGRFGGNSRREVGHSALAERAVVAVVPDWEKFPYTIRLVSEVLESNGSSSMASVCGGSMALMDAGVPIKNPVAGIAMGLMKEGNDVVILSDILGDEDHMGDMDFKVCGTRQGITAVQMDIKMDGVTREIMSKALMQAREGRLHILDEMNKAIQTHRSELSPFAPRITSLQISTEKIKDLIGPGGKNIKGIVAATGVKIDIEDSGKVNVASNDPAATAKALEMIAALTEEPVIGKIYMGTVVRIADYGAFVNIMPGTDGLVHVSELDHQRVQFVTDVVQEGDQIPVKILEIDRSGKIRLSRKAALPSPSSTTTTA